MQPTTMRLCAEADALREVVRRIAAITPREGEWESSYRVLPRRVRELLGKLPQRA